MPTAQRIQPMVFLVRWLTIRAPAVPKSPKATPALMMLAIRHGTFPSRVPITVAARIKDTQMPQTTQAIRCARPEFAIFPVTLYGDSIDVLLLSRRVKLSHAKKDSAYAYYHITPQSSQKRYSNRYKLTRSSVSFWVDLISFDSTMQEFFNTLVFSAKSWSKQSTLNYCPNR